jgi:hypothetical protein
MRAEAIVWNAVPPVSSTLTPTAMFMLPILRAMALPNLSRFRAPVFGPVGLAPIVPSIIAPVILRLRMMLPVRSVVVCTLLPVLALIVPLFVPLLVVVAPVLVRALLRASVFLSVLVAMLSTRGSCGAKSQNQCRCAEDRYDFHLSSVDCI